MDPQDLKPLGFTFVAYLGKGSFSHVLHVVDKIGHSYALKCISKKVFHHQHSLQNNTQLNLNHKNVLKSLDTFQSPTHFYIKMQLAGGGTLKQLIKSRGAQGFTETEVAQAANGILSGIIYLHRQNIIHRDIKPENILIGIPNDLTSIIISDLGLSAFRYDRLELQKRKGTPLYMAPQMTETTSTFYDKPIDIWSIGLVLFQMLTKGRHIIHARNLDEFLKQLKVFQYKWQHELSDQANSFIGSILKARPQDRPRPFQILIHPFLSTRLDGKPALSYSQTFNCYDDQQTLMRSFRVLLFLELQKNFQEKENIPILSSKRSSFKIRKTLSPYGNSALKTLDLPPKKKVQFQSDCPARKQVEDIIKTIMIGHSQSNQKINGSAESTVFNQIDSVKTEQDKSQEIQKGFRIRTIKNSSPESNKLSCRKGSGGKSLGRRSLRRSSTKIKLRSNHKEVDKK